MTYSLAWRSDKEIYMAADTAITSSGDFLGLNTQESSFGQEHFLNKDKSQSVEESVVKLFLKDNVGMTFAGSYGLAIRLAQSFYEEIAKGVKPLEALKFSLFSNPPIENENIQLAIGYIDNGPKLITYNAKPDSGIEENHKIIQLGNPLNFHKDLSEDWINDLINSSYSADLGLTAMLGVFQSYNLFSPQMERGIGGAFCGLYIDDLGGHWQPDILFIEDGGKRPKLVSTCFRHECLVINSPTIGKSRCLMSYIPPLSMEFLQLQTRKAVIKGKMLSQKAEFEYIVILNVEGVTITVIEMKRNRKHGIIWIEPHQDEKGSYFEISLFYKIRKLLRRTAPGLVVLHYWAPNIKKIPEDKVVKGAIIKYD